MDFKHLESVIEKHKCEIITDNFSKNYIYMVILNQISIADINFNAFDADDLINIHREIEQAITDEDMEGNISIDPNHPFTKIYSFGEKIAHLERIPKVRSESPYVFL